LPFRTNPRRAAALRAALIALLPFAGCAPAETPAEAAARAEETPEGRPSLEAALRRLPVEAAGFRRGSTSDAGNRFPPGTRLVDYATPSRTAAAQVFLLDRPLSGQLSGGDAAAELDAALRDAAAASPDRTGRSLSETSRHELALPRGTPLRCAVLDGSFGRNPVERHVCAATAAGRVLRVVVTMPDRNPDRAEAAGRFAQAVAAALRG